MVNKNKKTSKLNMNLRTKTLLTISLIVLLLVLVIITSLSINPGDIKTNFQLMNQAPSFEHLFGTDWIGRDMFTRTLKGLGLSIQIGIVASILSSIIAVILGLLSILIFPHAIMHEASVTFLGFGLSPHEPAIGVILSESMKYLATGNWWLALFPGLSLLIIVLLFDIVGENIKKLLNPASANN